MRRLLALVLGLLLATPVLADMYQDGSNAKLPEAKVNLEIPDKTISIKEPHLAATRGAICDGASHPLSTWYPTLAAAQAEFPTATALTNELDGVAINNAIAYARTVLVTGSTAVQIVLPQGICLADVSINATVLRGSGIEFLATGNLIRTTAKDLVAWDAVGNERVKYTNLYIKAEDPAKAPKVGFQFGRHGLGQTAASNIVQSLTITGNFAQTVVLNVMSESNHWRKPFLQNQMPRAVSTASSIAGTTLTVGGTVTNNYYVGMGIDGTNVMPGTYITALGTGTGGAGTYTVNYSQTVAATTISSQSFTYIGDGMNHWDFRSQYYDVTSLPKDDAGSFGGNLYLSGEFRSATSSPSMWLSGTHAHTFMHAYILSVGGDHAVILYQDSDATDNRSLYIKGRIEQDPLSYGFLLTGTCVTVLPTCATPIPQPSPRLPNFTFMDDQPQAQIALFKTGPGITDVQLSGAEIRMPRTLNSAGVVLIDQPDLWVVSGNFLLQRPRIWNVKRFLGGRVCFDDTTSGITVSCRGDETVLYSRWDAPAVWTNTGLGTDERNLLSFKLPILMPNDSVWVNALFDTAGVTTNRKDMVVRFSGSACTPGSTCTAGTVVHRSVLDAGDKLSGSSIVIIHNTSSDAAQVGSSTSSDGGLGISASHPGSPAIASGFGSGSAYVLVNCQTVTASTDTCKLLGATIKLIPGTL